MARISDINAVMPPDKVLEMFKGCILANMNSIDKSWDKEVQVLKDKDFWSVDELIKLYVVIRGVESSRLQFPKSVVKLVRWINENALSQVYLQFYKKIYNGNKQSQS